MTADVARADVARADESETVTVATAKPVKLDGWFSSMSVHYTHLS